MHCRLEAEVKMINSDDHLTMTTKGQDISISTKRSHMNERLKFEKLASECSSHSS
jgi:hypothetical protein